MLFKVYQGLFQGWFGVFFRVGSGWYEGPFRDGFRVGLGPLQDFLMVCSRIIQAWSRVHSGLV